jgi:preprotein translocase subunit SecG
MQAIIDVVVPVIHVCSCLFLIVVVLLQTGKGADMGAVFGGGSQTLFGSGGAGNLLTKLTTGTAIAFMLTSLILTAQGRSGSSSVLNKVPVEAAVPAASPPATVTPTTAPQRTQVTINIPIDPGPSGETTITIPLPPPGKPAAPAPAGKP